MNETSGEVVTYNGDLIKPPYFNESDGQRTLSAEEVWGWTDTPYLTSVDTSQWDDGPLNGHGVGLSGHAATQMAEAGWDYVDIIQYFYQGVNVETLNQ